MKRSLLLLCLLTLAGSTYAFDGNAPLIEGGSWKWLTPNLVLFAAGIVLFVIIVRRLYDARLRHQKRDAPVAKALRRDNIYEPRYWYQCKNCRVTVRKDSPPNTADCFQAVDHKWTQLAEVGSIKYLCKRCNTLIETRGLPVADNCPDADVHVWEKLP